MCEEIDFPNWRYLYIYLPEKWTTFLCKVDLYGRNVAWIDLKQKDGEWTEIRYSTDLECDGLFTHFAWVFRKGRWMLTFYSFLSGPVPVYLRLKRKHVFGD